MTNAQKPNKSVGLNMGLIYLQIILKTGSTMGLDLHGSGLKSPVYGAKSIDFRASEKWPSG
jgi:hypothetical protein